MIVLLNRQTHRPDGSVDNFPNFGKNFLVAASPAFTKARVLVYFACSCISLACLSVVEIRDYSPSNKEMAYLTREGYLQEELLLELIVPGFLNHTIHIDILTFYFSLPLCCCCFLPWRLVLKRLRWKSYICVCLLSWIKLWYSN